MTYFRYNHTSRCVELFGQVSSQAKFGLGINWFSVTFLSNIILDVIILGNWIYGLKDPWFWGGF